MIEKSFLSCSPCRLSLQAHLSGFPFKVSFSGSPFRLSFSGAPFKLSFRALICGTCLPSANQEMLGKTYLLHRPHVTTYRFHNIFVKICTIAPRQETISKMTAKAIPKIAWQIIWAKLQQIIPWWSLCWGPSRHKCMARSYYCASFAGDECYETNCINLVNQTLRMLQVSLYYCVLDCKSSLWRSKAK